ncbi:hypothetical protein JXA48_05325, partial [Candidatus Woesearchaeota archaeon]|nr:hypothetical protein [Candidatus Woesearchaeota archaeon]
MKNLDLIQTIFLAFLVAIFLKVFEYIFNLLKTGLGTISPTFGPLLAQIYIINIVILIISFLIGYYPKIINLNCTKRDHKAWIILSKKVSAWSLAILTLLTFAIWFISARAQGLASP